MKNLVVSDHNKYYTSITILSNQNKESTSVSIIASSEKAIKICQHIYKKKIIVFL